MDRTDTPGRDRGESGASRSHDPRRKVLLSAYACGPNSGPEAGAGWEMAVAAAQTSDVWVITRPRFRTVIEEALAAQPTVREHLRVIYHDPAPWIVQLKRRSWDLYWFYLLWQRGISRLAVTWHARVGFDVAHHVTFANDWMPAGVTRLRGVPLVWGPVGGSSGLPVLRLARWLGPRGTLTELARAVITTPLRAWGGLPSARRSSVVVAQNPQVAGYFRRHGANTVVEPNACLTGLPPRAAVTDEKTAVFAGRLLGWKGAALAIDAVSRPELADWTLEIYGDGYDRRRLERRAAARGVAGRVRFHGHVDRDQLWEAMRTATVFLFPSMHDQAGWVVAEASSIGCPVVCLPLGGPPVLAEPNAFVADLSGDVPRSIAEQVLRAAATDASPTDRWSVTRLPAIVQGWYDRATEGSASAAPTAFARAAGRARPLAILESFREPKETTNPYITQLYRALRRSPDAEVRAFDYRTALLGRYDVVHVHWPELLVGGHKGIGRLARRVLTALTVARWRLRSTPVVRTLHNLERPQGISSLDHRILDRIDALTRLDIHLNDHTPARAGTATATIRHGHYRDWYERFPTAEPTPGRILYVGLIRRYKGVEDLVDAFVDSDRAELSLHVAGKASSDELIQTLHERARGDTRVSIDARFLSDTEMVDAITSSELVVLPYRHMHNSGTALAVLSLDRAVLLPDNEVNRALADEVGPGWVHVYSGTVSTEAIHRAWEASRARTGRPDLSAREWDDAASAHLSAFRRAAERRR